MTEADFIAALRALPLHPGAQQLRDDTARLGELVLTTDTIVEGVHYLSEDAAADVAWKLLAVNLSDLAAKGAVPEGALLNYPLGDDGWDRDFLNGLGETMNRFDCPLLGGDTVSLPHGAPRVISLTAVGRASRSPARSGARAGDMLYVTGTIGDAGAGLRIATGEDGPDSLAIAYRRPHPRLGEGRALGAVARAMMDVSDGLLIDAARMADASGLAVAIDLAAVPLSSDLRAFAGDDRNARLAAVTAGDDYELLFAMPPGETPPVAATRIGRFAAGTGLSLQDNDGPIALPDRIGFEHRA
ncbi:thiamine-phosphate kinase [Stakelama marina]|uniref:Thiamine-monophosphate kinase n=1 Tax=Stakelama marina TaxID=2826939 RepID=A0A8T4IDT5_9SPHN|nr:thiamine-phosphate kinase [Stakelama marina]MBR0552581.1 thiamine-phosphate kinase [Stakelama marina]